MAMRNTPTRYGLAAQTLHWLIVFLLPLQYLLAEWAEERPSAEAEAQAMGWHHSVGLTVLLLAALRLVWRWSDPPPPTPPMPTWQGVLASATHWAFYLLLFAIPLSGWLQAATAGTTVAWFGWSLPELTGPDGQLEDVFHELHEILFTVLLGLAALHVGAALKHHFIDRNGLLWRMLPWGGRS